MRNLWLLLAVCGCLAQAQTPAPKPQPATPATPAAAPVPTPAPPVQDQVPDFKQGAVYGHVQDPSGKPVVGAMVAVKNGAGKVLAWCKTDDKGDYALPINPKTALSLKASHHRTLLDECVRSVGDVVMTPVRMIVSPGPTVKSGIESVASGTPAPVVAQGIATAAPSQQSVQGATATAAMGDGPPGAPQKINPKGQAHIVISGPGFKDADVQPAAYWLEPPEQNVSGLRAWVESVKLVPSAAKENSDVVKQALTLSDGVATPILVPPGGDVNLTVKLNEPPGPDRQVRVFAREARKGTVVELQPGADKVTYTGKITIDPTEPQGDSSICIAALRTEPVEVKLPKSKNDPLVIFARRLPDMQSAKPYQYDPCVMASENRADLKITVLPKKA